jgi:hypothetical protein
MLVNSPPSKTLRALQPWVAASSWVEFFSDEGSTWYVSVWIAIGDHSQKQSYSKPSLRVEVNLPLPK